MLISGGCGFFGTPWRDKDIAYEYPQLSKTMIALEGDFLFTIDPSNQGLLKSYHEMEFDDKDWRKIQAPATWESQGISVKNPNNPGDALPYSGYAWYRKWVEVPSDWKDKQLEINLGRVDDAEVCFWNGEKIGETRSLAQANLFIIPEDKVNFGGKNLIALRVMDTGGEGGIVSGPLTLRPILPWEELSLEVVTPDGLFVFEPDAPIRLDISIKNPLKVVMDTTFHLVIRDFDQSVVYRQKFDIRLNRNLSTPLTIEIPPKPRGHYDCKMDLLGENLHLKTFRTSFVVLGSPVVFEEPKRSPFALGGGALFHIKLEEHRTVGERRLRQHARIGALWGRNDLWWGRIEPVKGQWDFKKADSAVELFDRYHINLLGILCYSTEWLDGKAPVSDDQIADFANYCSRMASRYRDKVHYWEVWNEPNIVPFWEPRPDANDYVRLLKEAYPNIKKASPKCQVVGMVTSLTDLRFIEKCLERGAGEYLDVLSVHPYQLQSPTDWSSRTELGKIRQLSTLMEEYKCSKPIWITECGWQTLGGVTERLQAQHLVKFYVLTLAEGLVDRVYWFNLTDWGKRHSPEGGHFGLVHMDHSPKPSYAAYYTMVEQLHDFTSIKEVYRSGGINGFDFHFKDGHRVRVVWTEKKPALAPVPKGAKVIDLVGGRVKQKGREIRIDKTPRYIVGGWD